MTHRLPLLILTLLCAGCTAASVNAPLAADEERAASHLPITIPSIRAAERESSEFADRLTLSAGEPEPVYRSYGFEQVQYRLNLVLTGADPEVVALPFESEYLSGLESLFTYEVLQLGEWTMRPRTPSCCPTGYRAERMVRLAQGDSISLPIALDLDPRDGDPTIVRIRFRGAVSNTVLIDWSRDRQSERLKAMRDAHREHVNEMLAECGFVNDGSDSSSWRILMSRLIEAISTTKGFHEYGVIRERLVELPDTDEHGISSCVSERRRSKGDVHEFDLYVRIDPERVHRGWVRRAVEGHLSVIPLDGGGASIRTADGGVDIDLKYVGAGRHRSRSEKDCERLRQRMIAVLPTLFESDGARP
jgi:hypothetical protein